ncbi:hypothetical protein AB0D04_07640 [Streptomyces sp. NPDC048483]|uniref:hypothetical protein n=1 Tax=Streptomyces sp. NPDC048483 TaxID=3154927 RepID=UPI00343968F5
MPEINLMPLRIPSGWCIAHHTFAELPDHAEPAPDDRAAYPSEDLLSPVSTTFTGQGRSTTENPG